MLSLKHIRSASEIAGSATYSGLALLPMQGSPLSILNGKVRPMMAEVADKVNEVDVAGGNGSTVASSYEITLHELSKSVDMSGVESHSVEMGEITRFVSDNLSASLNYARNVINPLVSDILDKTQKAQQLATTGSALSRPIVEMEIPEIYSDGLLDTLIERNKGLPSSAKPLSDNLADTLLSGVTEDAYLQAVKLNNPTFDAKVVSALKDHAVEPGLLTYTVNRTHGYSPFRDNHPILAYLYLLAVKNGNVPEIDTTALTSDERLEVSSAINYYGFMVNKQIDDFDMYARKNFIVDVHCSDWKAIKVIGPTYRNWLDKQGGEPEAVLGFMTTNNDSGMVTGVQGDLWSNVDKYKAIYDRVLRTEIVANRLESNRAVDKTLKHELYLHIKEENADSIEDRRVLQARVEEYMGKTKYTTSMDLDMHILRTVCNVLCTDKNDAFEIITSMRTYLTDNPESTPATAALIAATKLVAKWVVSQMVVTR